MHFITLAPKEKPQPPSFADKNLPLYGYNEVKRVIHSRSKRGFLTRGGTWTRDVGSAARFLTQRQALAAAEKLGLRNVELYCALKEDVISEMDFTMPLVPVPLGGVAEQD